MYKREHRNQEKKRVRERGVRASGRPSPWHVLLLAAPLFQAMGPPWLSPLAGVRCHTSTSPPSFGGLVKVLRSEASSRFPAEPSVRAK